MSTKLKHPDRAFLERIGDDALLAEGVPDYCIKQWKYRGVPWSARAKVARIARSKRVRLPDRFAEVKPAGAAA